jgi:hypothetical protein
VDIEQARAWIGHPVVYRPTEENEMGVIKYVGKTFAWVLYQGKVTAVATLPQDLERA